MRRTVVDQCVVATRLGVVPVAHRSARFLQQLVDAALDQCDVGGRFRNECRIIDAGRLLDLNGGMLRVRGHRNLSGLASLVEEHVEPAHDGHGDSDANEPDELARGG